MRWKDFMANSLPRSWTKTRKRNSVLKNQKNNENLENQENNNKVEEYDNKTQFDQNDNHFRYENKCTCVKEIPIAIPRSSIIPRRNRNLSTYNSLPKTNPFLQETRIESRESKSSPETKHDTDDRMDDTLPKTRSRIKTNPWLPSPKIPAASLTINFAASNSSLLSSPSGSRCSSMDRSLGSRSSSVYLRSRSLDSPRDFDLMEMVKFDDDCQSGSGKLSSGIGLASDGEGTSISSMESEGFVFYESLDDLRSSPDLTNQNQNSNNNNNNNNNNYNVDNDSKSFTYEDHFESMLESFHEKTKDSCTSLDLLHDAEIDVLALPPRRSRARIIVPKDFADEVDDGIGHSDDEIERSHLYVNLDYTKPKVKRNPKVNPKPRLSISSTDSNDSFDFELNKSETKRTRCSDKSNLEAKIHQLRRDKFMVDEKIRAAQEEERVREKLRYHQQVTLQRKEILARTLTDLRTKLEGQCHRLQTNYSKTVDEK